MTENSDNDDLAGLRRRIDAIDDRMADLIVERMAVVDEIRACKQRAGNHSRSAMRPGREAEVIRRVVERIGAAMPAPATARIWRELISAATRAQSPFTVHISGQIDQQACAIAARDQFGVLAPVVWHNTTSGALAAVIDDPVDLAVLEIMADCDDPNGAPWWALAGARLGSAFHIIARADEAADDRLKVVVATIEPEPSGCDVTYLVATGSGAARRSDDVLAALCEAGLDAGFIASTVLDGIPRVMTGIDGFITPQDDRLHRAAGDPRLSRVTRAGAAAAPTHNNGQSS